MQIQKRTKLSTSLTHDEIVAFLALGVKVQAGIVPSAPGSSATVTLKQGDDADRFTAEIVILIDHSADGSESDQAAVSAVSLAPLTTATSTDSSTAPDVAPNA